MPYTIIDNKKNGSVTIHMVANSGNIIVVGNNSVSNLAIAGENVQAVAINQIWFGSPSGANAYWEVKRGANTVLVLDSTAYIDFAGNGRQIKLDQSANLTANLVNSTVGFLTIELQKLGSNDRPPLGANSDYIVPGQ